MFWADKLLKDREVPEWINDAWTPSGIVHMGGLKGPVIHDTLLKILEEKGHEVKFTFGFDDMDPIDGLPKNLAESHKKYMGIPICNAPAPKGEGSFGDYYANMMRSLFEKLNIHPEIYLASDYYKKGIYDNAISFVLDNAAKIRNVYSEMYGKEVSDKWYPLQVICPDCGKLGTTKVTGWDGDKVSFICKENLVEWAKGCSKAGKISPFKGNSKMPFKVEWAAKWWTFKVTIEGAGKDHASAGGTYDVARKIVKDVFGQEPPLALPYEFFLYDGKKMSSSKGLGLTGESLLEVLPPEVARFLMIKTLPNQAVEFNPNGTQIIPRVFDEYQEYAGSFYDKKSDDYARIFEVSQIGEIKKPPKISFMDIVKMIHDSPEKKVEGAEEWVDYVKLWINKYAPKGTVFEISESLPEEVKDLTDKQREYLKNIAQNLDKNLSPKEFEKNLYDASKEIALSSKDAFAAVYVSFAGKTNGPKAVDLILQNKEFAKKRFEEASK